MIVLRFATNFGLPIKYIISNQERCSIFGLCIKLFFSLLYKNHQTKLGHQVQRANTFGTGGCQKTILGAIAQSNKFVTIQMKVGWGTIPSDINFKSTVQLELYLSDFDSSWDFLQKPSQKNHFDGQKSKILQKKIVLIIYVPKSS